MADFNFVTNRLATGGGIATAADLNALAAAGITAIVYLVATRAGRTKQVPTIRAGSLCKNGPARGDLAG